MLFDFLKYLQPTSYFQLSRTDGSSVFPITSELPEGVMEQIEADENFKSELASQYDVSWQAIQKGYIGDTLRYQSFEKLPLEDEYRFVRKYFNPLWATYVLLLRLLSFKNPFNEISAWWASRNTKRSNYLNAPINYNTWNNFESPSVISQPLVTVVIPTLNRYPYLKGVLLDLEKQDYKNFEIIVVDQSEPFLKEFYDDYNLDIHFIHQEEKALWLARNTAIQKSKGDLLLLFDDDSRIESDWITSHIKCLDFFKAEISSGVSISTIGAKVPENYSFFRVSDQIDTGNVLIKKEVFRTIGLFDRQFEKQRMGDGEFGLRSYLHGFLNISNPYAERLHLKAGTGGLRQMGSWDGMRPVNWFAPRPIPSIVYLFRTYFGNKLTRFALLKSIPPSLIPYKYKGNNNMLILGFLVTLVLFPLVLFQVTKSWRLASIKLKEGAIIEEL